MGLNYRTNPAYNGRIGTDTVNYPYGDSKNETAPNANDGMFYAKARADDILGMQQALLLEAGIVPSGNADTALESQYVEAMRQLFSRRRNWLINGGFDVNQRGVDTLNSPSVGDFSADRWRIYRTVGTTSVALIGGTTGAAFDQRPLRIMALTGDIGIEQRIEFPGPLIDREITFSFYAQSSTAVTLTVGGQSHADNGSNGAVQSESVSVTASGSSVFNRYEVNLTIPPFNSLSEFEDDGYVAVRISNPSGTVNLANLQVEVGAKASPFIQESYGKILSDCQRYFTRILDATELGLVEGATTFQATVDLPTTMRDVPIVAFPESPDHGTFQGAGSFTSRNISNLVQLTQTPPVDVNKVIFRGTIASGEPAVDLWAGGLWAHETLDFFAEL